MSERGVTTITLKQINKEKRYINIFIVRNRLQNFRLCRI